MVARGTEIPGETSEQLSFNPRAEDDGAFFAARLTYADGSVVYSQSRTLSLAPPAARIVNVSMRGWSGTGDDSLRVGVRIDGFETDKLLVRALGPALSVFGVEDTSGAVSASLRGLEDNHVYSYETEEEHVARIRGLDTVLNSAAESVGAYWPNMNLSLGDDQQLLPSSNAAPTS